METILIVDDEQSLLDLLSVVFKKEGYAVKTALTAAGGFEVLAKAEVDLVITDIKMPGADGMDILRYARENLPDLPVILITAYGSIAQAVEALKAGALDYVVKPFDVEELKIIVGRGLAGRRLRQENLLLKRDFKDRYGFEQMIGKSRPMQDIYTLIEKVASTDSTVLITGESGTGKEMAARAVHLQGARRDNSFVSINCAALPENLLESELFGHVRGSFTGAVSDKKGMFELAQRGTLFLDEVGETSPWTQVKLLRALQERKVRRVGGADEIPVDVRIIAATNQDLKKRIGEGKFREELFYRLNVISMDMPPLRRRVEDIPLLISHFLQKYCDKMGKKPKRFTPEVVGLLEGYAWPGNIRELENVIERAVALEQTPTVLADSLPGHVVGQGPRPGSQAVELPQEGIDLEQHVQGVEREFIAQALRRAGGVQVKAAELVGMSFRSFRYYAKKYNLR